MCGTQQSCYVLYFMLWYAKNGPRPMRCNLGNGSVGVKFAGQSLSHWGQLVMFVLQLYIYMLFINLCKPVLNRTICLFAKISLSLMLE